MNAMNCCPMPGKTKKNKLAHNAGLGCSGYRARKIFQSKTAVTHRKTMASNCHAHGLGPMTGMVS